MFTKLASVGAEAQCSLMLEFQLESGGGSEEKMSFEM